MYAIVEMKGQQFKVEAGKKLFINRMNELEKGATVEFENVLLLDNEGKVKVGAPYVKGAKVVCEVLDNECRGEKVLETSQRLSQAEWSSSRFDQRSS